MVEGVLRLQGHLECNTARTHTHTHAGNRLHDSDNTEATSLCIIPPEQQVCICGVVRKPTSEKFWLDSPHVTALVGPRP